MAKPTIAHCHVRFDVTENPSELREEKSNRLVTLSTIQQAELARSVAWASDGDLVEVRGIVELDAKDELRFKHFVQLSGPVR